MAAATATAKQEVDSSSRTKMSLESLARTLCDENEPIAKRTRCVFLMKQIGGTDAIDAMAPALRSPSVLLSHEVAYVMGQMQDKHAVPHLTRTLADKGLDPITRHEAAEALAAISEKDSLDVLRQYVNDESREVRETVELSIARILWNKEHGGEAQPNSVYESVDPAPAENKVKTVGELEAQLCDPKVSMFDRYKAMFALRNLGTEEAVLALASGYKDESALFRHEVAYVMGQLQHPAAVASLKERLLDEKEHAMVRHEAAEALGSIADDTCPALLRDFQKPETDRIIRESCDVALDLCDYWTNEEVSSAVPQEA